MKKITTVFLSFLLLSNLPLFSQQVDTTFYNFGWQKMMLEGADYKEISAAAALYYDSINIVDPAKKYKHFQRWKRYWSPRIYTSPEEVSNGKSGLFHHHSTAIVNMINNVNCSNHHPSSNWESWGFKQKPQKPTGGTERYFGMGAMWCVKIDESDPSLQTIYAGAPTGGVWKTTDQGLNWSNISDNVGVPALNVSDIAIDPTNNQHLLVSTGTRWSLEAPGIGIFETYDGGLNWNITGLAPISNNYNLNFIKEVHFHPSDSTKYFALLQNKLVISTNKGVTWDSIIYTDTNNTYLQNLRFNPNNPDTMYLTTSGHNARVLRSSDGGATWNDITSNFYSGSHTIAIAAIDVSPQNSNLLYVAIEAGNLARYYLSRDRGTTGILINKYSNYSIFNKIGQNKSVFMINPADTNNGISGGVVAFVTNDGFSSLSSKRAELHDDARGGDIVDGLVVLAHDGGISISTNNGLTWTLRSGMLDVQQHFGFDVDKDFTYLFTGLQDNGFYRFDIPTKTWNAITGGEGGTQVISEFNSSQGMGSTYCGLSSCNFGYSHIANSGYVYNRSNSLYNQAQAHSAEERPITQSIDKRYYTAMEDIFYKEYDSSSWIRLTNFDGTGFKGNSVNDFGLAIESSPLDSNFLVIGFSLMSDGTDENRVPCNPRGHNINCHQKKVLLSKDRGITWKDITQNLPIAYAAVSDIELHPEDMGKMWVSFSNYWTGNKVYFTSDTGNTWTNISHNLPNQPVHNIEYQPNSNDRVFIAMDGGIYTKDAAMNYWDCYGNNLPVAFYIDLKINNCGGSIVASSQGRGMWKSPLPPNRLIGNITWDGHRTVGSDIIVQDTLTITGTVEMAYNTKITVEVGGKLIIDGGMLTSSHCIDSLWQGVELLGDIRYHQTGDPMSAGFTQSYLKMTNGGIIENAEVGIYAGSLSSENYGGGLIVTEDSAMIRNCRTGVFISPYAKLNKSTFTNTTFINDGTLLDPLTGTALKTDVHVSINGMTVVGNEFNNCTFENQNLALLPYDRGIGLDLTGRKVGTTNNPMLEACNFIGLHYGVQAGNLSSGVGNDMEYNTFTNTQRGIYVFAGYSLDLHNNTFNLPEATVEDVYGIKLNACENFDIRGNSVLGSSSPSQGTYFNSGIVIENSSDAGGIVFDNTIGNGQHLEVGIQAQGENQSLTIRCNDIEYQGTNPHGLAVYDYFVSFGGQIQAYNPAQLRDQGHPNCQTIGQTPGDHKAAAGNEWKNLCNSGTDQEIDMEPGMTFKYFWHRRNQFNVATTVPDCSDPNWNSDPSLYINCFTDKAFNSCNDLYTPPTTGGGGGGSGPGGGGLFRLRGGADSSEVALFEQRYLSAVHQQQALESNISQQAALQAILHYTTSSKQKLLTASPLSDGLLVAAIEEWSTNHPADLKAVLLENTPLSKEVITALQKAQLAHLWQATIQQANPTHALRDSLVKAADQLRFAKKELMLKEAQVYRKLQANGRADEAEELLENSQLSASLRLLCKEYISLGDFGKANDLLTNIETKTDDGEAQRNQNFVRFSRTVIPIYQNGKSGRAAAMMDEAQVSAALEKLPREHSVEGNEVEALRELWNKEFFHHPVMRKARQSNAVDFGSAQSDRLLQNLSVFPNPASGSATIVYDLKGSNTATIQFFDAMGKRVKELSLLPKMQQQEIDLSALNSGVYHFSVLLKGERLFNGKLIITQ